jgi:hypothetical protein
MSEYNNYWRLIETYLPNYSKRDDVLLSDILYRYITNDEVSTDDLDYIELNFTCKDDVIAECIYLEEKFFEEVISNYYSQFANKIQKIANNTI